MDKEQQKQTNQQPVSIAQDETKRIKTHSLFKINVFLRNLLYNNEPEITPTPPAIPAPAAVSASGSKQGNANSGHGQTSGLKKGLINKSCEKIDQNKPVIAKKQTDELTERVEAIQEAKKASPEAAKESRAEVSPHDEIAKSKKQLKCETTVNLKLHAQKQLQKGEKKKLESILNRTLSDSILNKKSTSSGSATFSNFVNFKKTVGLSRKNR
jgi:hypothetical protein